MASTECSSGRVEDTEPLSKTIQILGVEDSRTASKCKYYFENPEKGGGEIQEAKWDSIDRICYITFSDMTGRFTVHLTIYKDISPLIEYVTVCVCREWGGGWVGWQIIEIFEMKYNSPCVCVYIYILLNLGIKKIPCESMTILSKFKINNKLLHNQTIKGI